MRQQAEQVRVDLVQHEQRALAQHNLLLARADHAARLPEALHSNGVGPGDNDA